MKRVAVAITIGLVLVALIITFGQIFTVRYIDVEFVNSVKSTEKQEIIDATGINTNTNIFTLDEKKIKTKIQNSFEDNSIKVNDIVREFPNKVVVRVSERTPLFKIRANTDEKVGFVVPDRNFQRTRVYTEEEIPETPLVEVNGFTVEGTYIIDECYALKGIANALIACGFAEEAIPYFLKSVNFEDGSVTICLRTEQTSFVLTELGDIEGELKRLYSRYQETDYTERNGKTYTE